MSATDSERIVRLEVTTDYHAKRIGFLENQGAAIVSALDSVKGNLSQIKWLAVGGACGYVLHEIGLFELIKGVIL